MLPNTEALSVEMCGTYSSLRMYIGLKVVINILHLNQIMFSVSSTWRVYISIRQNSHQILNVTYT